MGFPDVAQFPLNVVGPKGQNAFIGLTRILTGTGGMPLPFGSGANTRTTLGIPGVTATLVGTGAYALTFPPTVDVNILPKVSVPTGTLTIPSINTVMPYSGVTGAGRVFLTNGNNVNFGTGAGTPVNLATGASLDLLFFVAPVTAY